jgi:hypothetical protein
MPKPASVPSIRLHRTPFVLRALAALVVGLLWAADARASSRWAILEAIHHLENPRNLSRPGRHGELGAYQFRASTWQQHTSVPFRQALNRAVSDIVAVKHYEHLKRMLEAAGLPGTPYNIALAWNGGINAAVSGTSPRIAHDYAQRAANLAATFSPPRVVASAR